MLTTRLNSNETKGLFTNGLFTLHGTGTRRSTGNEIENNVSQCAEGPRQEQEPDLLEWSWVQLFSVDDGRFLT